MAAAFQQIRLSELRAMSEQQLSQVAEYLRNRIISVVAEKGGHLGASLGVVELTVALHYVLNTPFDRIVFDVGHQIYAHKILTGRDDRFDSLRQLHGISGFPKRSESEFDAFGTGHSSTAISAVMGMALAAKLSGEESQRFVAIVGDASIAGGMSFEALNHLAETKANVIVLLNDNNMGIDPSTGALKKHLNQIDQHTGSNFFENLSLPYTGPIDGHNIEELVQTLTELNERTGPQVLHVKTVKGKGLASAEADQITYHAPGKFEPKTGTRIISNEPLKYQDVFAQTLITLGQDEPRLVAVTPAMLSGSGLHAFKERFPLRTFDVGIAEQHAVTLAAGMAAEGYLPVCHLYSTFLQRGYDQIIHDVALQHLPVIFAIDRAGIVGEDGPTHHGLFDIAALRAIPNMTLIAPANAQELFQAFYTVVERFKKGQLIGPVGIRYPRGSANITEFAPKKDSLGWGQIQRLRTSAQAKIALITTGPFMEYAERLSDLKQQVDCYHVPFIKPLDLEALKRLADNGYKAIFTLEDAAIQGGWGEGLGSTLHQFGYRGELTHLGVGDAFVPHGKVSELYLQLQLDFASVKRRLEDTLNRLM